MNIRLFFLICASFFAFSQFLSAAENYRPPKKNLGFPVYTNQPPGRQVTGAHAPAATPALSPAEAQKKFTLPEGFEIRLFASEPEVVNPVAMTWDERGRLWVVELYEYPLGAKDGQKPRDRIKILEDTDGDGVADKVTVFADGFSLATGILLGYGGVFVGQAPDLLFLEDTNGDDIADKRTVLKTGFGLEDRHELLNSFTWGPGGWLYMTHGVFTQSKVKDPSDPNASGVTMNAAIARYHPRTKKFEVVSDGTSNPWGVDFDRYGNAFVSACVIDHFFHLAPGGVYVRQGGVPANPYTYELLPSIVDHKHHMAAYAGVQIYQGNQFPAEYLGTALMGNIHDNAIHQDRLTPNGSSFKASIIKDFVRANDGWFMPVSTQVGPDGAVWIMDWYDKYPCYQNAGADPEGVDREHGRIWRVVYTGNEKGKAVPSRPSRDMDLKKLSSLELVKLLEHPNVWQRRMAQRILSERHDLAGGNTLHEKGPLHALMKNGATLEARLAALWTLHSADLLEDEVLDVPAEDKEPAMRAWAARITGDRGYPLGDAIKRLAKLAEDPDPTVRLAVATAARQFVSGSLTVNTPPTVPIREVITGPILSALWFSSHDANDPLIPFMYWMALEPIAALDPVHCIDAYQKDGALPQMPLSGILLTKIMRRTCDLRDEAVLSRAVLAFGKIPESATPTLIAGLKGLAEGQRGKALAPSAEAVAVISKLAGSADKELAQLAQQLATLWGDASALKKVLSRITDASATDDERVKAIQSVRQSKTRAARESMLAVLDGKASDAVVVETIRALSEVGGDGVGELIVERWKNLSPAARREAAETLNSRSQWRGPFLAAIEQRVIAP
ncbi:MAG: dehydrogenase, partial [Verrucomicrobia bacterium]|nr:dehydrogenase [Verrucomicrobiota bacterium]